jgi:hypothetical protein
MDVTLGELRARVHGREIAKVLKDRYSDDKLAFGSGTNSEGILKVVVTHPPSQRMLVATFEPESGPAWRPLFILKNTFIPSEYEDLVVALFADNLMLPIEFDTVEEQTERHEFLKALLKKHWTLDA